jgi:hypothetical protein
MRDRSSSEINALLAMPSHFWEMAEDITYKDTVFWREQISLKNVETGLPSITVSGRSKPAMNGRAKTSHFEE